MKEKFTTIDLMAVLRELNERYWSCKLAVVVHKYGQFDYICEINGHQVGHVSGCGCGYYLCCACLPGHEWVWLPCIAVSPCCSLPGMRWVGVATMYCCVPLPA